MGRISNKPLPKHAYPYFNVIFTELSTGNVENPGYWANYQDARDIQLQIRRV
jgi:hypothetical protein